MARTKQTSRRSTSGATLFYRKKRKDLKRDLLNQNKTTTAAASKSNKALSPSPTSTSRWRLGANADIIITESWHNKHTRLSLTSSSMTRGASDTSLASLTDALSKLGSKDRDSNSSRSSHLSSPSFFSNSTRTLAIIKDVCEAFQGVPYVKSVAGLVQHIIEVVEEVQAYKERCRALVNKTILFSHGVFEGLLSLSRTTQSGEQIQSLESDLLAFFRVLECICAILNSFTTSRVSSRFLRYVARAEVLQSIEEQERNLESYIQYFNTRSNIALRLGLSTGLDQDVSPRFRSKIKRQITAPPKLHGREDEIASIVDLLTGAEVNKQIHLAILGSGGIGKTALASTVLGNELVINKFGDHRIFLSCDSASSLDLFIYELGSALDTTLEGPQAFQSIILRLKQQQYLLVFDNLETLWDPLRTRSEVESLLSEISSIPTVNLLITLRGSQHPAGVEWSQLLPPLQPLGLEAAKIIFQKISRKMDNHAVDLIKAVDRVPLAVTLLAHLAAVHGVTTESLWERWIEEKTMMIERGEDRFTNLDSSIRLSMSSPRMNHDPNALPFLSIIAMLPSGMSYDTFRACDAHLPEIINVKRAVNTLRQNALIYEGPDKTLHVLSPIRYYILSHHPPPDTAVEFVEDYFLRLALLGGEHVASVHDRLKVEIGNIEELLGKALTSTRPVQNSVSAILALAEYTYVSGIGSCTPLERAVERLEQLAEARPKPRKSMTKKLRRFLLGRVISKMGDGTLGKIEEDLLILRADCLGCWGQLLSRQGRYDQAKDKFEVALQLHVERGDLAGQAADLHNLGCLLTLEEALEKFTAASVLHERVGDRAGMAYDLMGSGQVHLQRCQLQQAKGVFSTALRIFEELGDDVIGRITAMNNMGHTLTAWNKFSEAEAYFNEALRANADIGDVVCRADSLCGLASTYLLRSRFQEAEKSIREAIALRKPYNDPDHHHVLGRVKCAQWKLTEAVEIFEYTKTLPRDQKDDSGRADNLKYLAYCLHLLGRVDEAQKILEDVKSLYQKAENVIGLAEVGIGQAEIFAHQGRLDEAEALLGEAVEVMSRLECALGRAHAMFVLSGVKLAGGEYREATKFIERALILHQGVGSIQGQADDFARFAEILIGESREMEESEKLGEASGYVKKALGLHEGIGDTAGMGDDWYLYAMIFLERGNVQEARDATMKALGLHATAGVVLKQGRDYALLGRILKSDEKVEEGIGAIESAISIFERMGAGRELDVCRETRARMNR